MAATSAAATSAATTSASATSASAAAPAFRFGVVADLQYADVPDGSSFSGTDVRRYRASLAKAADASRMFHARGVTCVMQLGDLIDGKAVGVYDPMLPLGSAPDDARARAIAAASSVIDALRGPYDIAHLRGNHENYSFALNEMQSLLAPPPGARSCSPELLAYAFAPSPAWRFIVLDPYDVSLAAPAGSAGRVEAERLLRLHNPAVKFDGTRSDYFAGRSGCLRRFVPFNGGIGAAQIAWLRAELDEAHRGGERVVVFCHVPLLPAMTRFVGGADADTSADVNAFDCVIFNDVEVLAELARVKNTVAAVFAGHDHEGSFGTDEAGIPHVTIQSPLVREEVAHGVVHVFEDRLELEGVGGLPSRTIAFRR